MINRHVTKLEVFNEICTKQENMNTLIVYEIKFEKKICDMIKGNESHVDNIQF